MLLLLLLPVVLLLLLPVLFFFLAPLLVIPIIASFILDDDNQDSGVSTLSNGFSISCAVEIDVSLADDPWELGDKRTLQCALLILILVLKEQLLRRRGDRALQSLSDGAFDGLHGLGDRTFHGRWTLGCGDQLCRGGDPCGRGDQLSWSRADDSAGATTGAARG